MKIKYAYFILAISTMFISACEIEKNCPPCFTPPEPVNMRVLDRNTLEDLIFNKQYNKDSISLFYFEDNIKQEVEIEVFSDSTKNSSYIYSAEMPWQCIGSPKTFILYLSKTDQNNILMEVLAKSSDCCTYHTVNEFSIDNEELELDYTTYSYTIWKE